MYTLYGYANSRSTRVIWLLEELALEYKYVAVDLFAGTAGDEDLFAITTSGKVPALKIDDAYFTESAAICNYLASHHQQAEKLIPADNSLERLRYDQWCYFALAELEQPLWTYAKHTFVLPEECRASGLEEAIKFEWDNAVRILHEGLADNNFILGNQFSVADILLAQTLAWAKSSDFDLQHDNLKQYFDRLMSRPALAKAQQREAAGS